MLVLLDSARRNGHRGVRRKNRGPKAVWGVGTILTLNPADFRRFPGIVVLTPAEILSTGSIDHPGI